MDLIKKLKTIGLLGALVICTSAYKFPEEMPNWQQLQNYKMSQLKIRHTNIDDFVKLCPGLKKKVLQNHLTIYEELISGNNLYQNLRIGFQYNNLDWLEFTLKPDIKITEFVQLYGKPSNVNTTYSNIYDYYDYGFFNVSTDKQHNFAYHITIFDLPAMRKEAKKLNLHLPDYYSYNFSTVLKPGELLESSFLDKYNGIVPFKKDRFDTTSIYSLNKNQIKSQQYKQVSLVFKNGLLNFISLEPVNLNIKDVINRYGADHTKEQMSNNRTYFEYPKFIMVVDNKTNKVLNVGLVSSF